MNQFRTIIEFAKDGKNMERTVKLSYELPNVDVGQQFSFDHPTMSLCLSGRVTRISHVVSLDAQPLTYIDVDTNK